jgi:hypothetical protein
MDTLPGTLNIIKMKGNRMKILGLFIVVFLCMFINQAMGVDFETSIFGTVIGSGVYILGCIK